MGTQQFYNKTIKDADGNDMRFDIGTTSYTESSQFYINIGNESRVINHDDVDEILLAFVDIAKYLSVIKHYKK